MKSAKRIITLLLSLFLLSNTPLLAFYGYIDGGFKYGYNKGDSEDSNNSTYGPIIDASIKPIEIIKLKGNYEYTYNRLLYDGEENYETENISKTAFSGYIYPNQNITIELSYTKYSGKKDLKGDSHSIYVEYDNLESFYIGFYYYKETDSYSIISNSINYYNKTYELDLSLYSGDKYEIPLEFQKVAISYDGGINEYSYTRFGFGFSYSFTDSLSSTISFGFGRDTDKNSLFDFSVDLLYIYSPPIKFYAMYMYQESKYALYPSSSNHIFFITATYGLEFSN